MGRGLRKTQRAAVAASALLVAGSTAGTRPAAAAAALQQVPPSATAHKWMLWEAAGKPGGGCPAGSSLCPALLPNPRARLFPSFQWPRPGSRWAAPARSLRHSPLLPTRLAPSTASLMSLGRR